MKDDLNDERDQEIRRSVDAQWLNKFGVDAALGTSATLDLVGRSSNKFFNGYVADLGALDTIDLIGVASNMGIRGAMTASVGATSIFSGLTADALAVKQSAATVLFSPSTGLTDSMTGIITQSAIPGVTNLLSTTGLLTGFGHNPVFSAKDYTTLNSVLTTSAFKNALANDYGSYAVGSAAFAGPFNLSPYDLHGSEISGSRLNSSVYAGINLPSSISVYGIAAIPLIASGSTFASAVSPAFTGSVTMPGILTKSDAALTAGLFATSSLGISSSNRNNSLISTQAGYDGTGGIISTSYHTTDPLAFGGYPINPYGLISENIISKSWSVRYDPLITGMGGIIGKSPTIYEDNIHVTKNGSLLLRAAIPVVYSEPSTTTKIKVNVTLARRLGNMNSSIRESYISAVEILNTRAHEYTRYMCLSLRQVFDYFVKHLPNKKELLKWVEGKEEYYVYNSDCGIRIDDRVNSVGVYVYLTQHMTGYPDKKEFRKIFDTLSPAIHAYKMMYDYDKGAEILERCERMMTLILDAIDALNS